MALRGSTLKNFQFVDLNKIRFSSNFTFETANFNLTRF
jgi:hypothetical protein